MTTQLNTSVTIFFQFWTGWFEGLSNKFLSVPASKLLLLAGVDRLDKDLTVGQVELIDGEVKVVVAAGRRFKLLVEEVLFQLKQKRRMLVLIATDRWQACWRYFTITEDKLSSSAEFIYNTTDNGFQAILNAAHWSSCAWEGGSKIVIYRATFSY